jgi:chloramphenicol-sensitive protein RarD
MLPSNRDRDFFIGALSGILANVLLGLSSVFWKYIGSLSAVALLSYRVYLSLLAVFLVVYAGRELRPLFAQLTIRLLFLHAGAAILIAINWGTFIWASVHGRVLESSLGYLVAPILSITIGIVVYKESVTVFKAIAVVVVLISVLGLLVLSNDLDVRVYLGIGLAWGFYSCLKKMTSLNVFSGLLLESLVLSFLCTLIFVFSDLSMTIPDDFGLWRTLLIFSCGVVSIVPLALFSFSAKRLSVMSMGLSQFVLPITQFFVATIIYKQTASPVTVVALLVVIVVLLMVVLEPVLRKLCCFSGRGRDEV